MQDNPELTQSAREKLAEFPFGCIKHPLSFFGSRILPPRAAPFSFHFDGEIAFLFQTMQQRINRARAHLVAMASKLFNHPETYQRLLRSMVKNVQPDKTADKLAVIRLIGFFMQGIPTHPCNPQLTILPHNQGAHQADKLFHYRLSLLTNVSMDVQSRKSCLWLTFRLRPRRSPVPRKTYCPGRSTNDERAGRQSFITTAIFAG